MSGPGGPTGDPRQDVAAACAVLGRAGLGGTIGGHVSVRTPQQTFWVNTVDLAFEEAEVDDVVELDDDLNLLSGDRPVSLGIAFHPAIYRARPDVGAIVHTHGFWSTAQSAFGRPPRSWNVLSTLFHGRVAIAGGETFDEVGAAIGPGDVAVVIPWHGAITVGPDLATAGARCATFEYACRLDVTLSATGAEPIADADVAAHRDVSEASGYLAKTWALLQRRTSTETRDER